MMSTSFYKFAVRFNGNFLKSLKHICFLLNIDLDVQAVVMEGEK